MEEQEYARLRKFIVVSWLLLLAVIVGMAFWGSYQVRLLNQTIAYKNAQLAGKIPYVKDGAQGQQGVTGQSGQAGRNGTNGSDGTNGQNGVNGSQGVPGPRGDKGDTGATGAQGEQGPQGRTVFTRTNPITGEGECRYAGDRTWQPESECQ